MVTGEGGAGYALQIADTNAMNWGGLLMFYFISGGASTACLNAQDYQGVAFSIRGSSPSGRFGVSLGMLDTTPVADNGLCDNPTASDCKSATVESALPTDATTWMTVQVPWDSLTPGVGRARACVPVTGQNILRLVIQPFIAWASTFPFLPTASRAVSAVELLVELLADDAARRTCRPEDLRRALSDLAPDHVTQSRHSDSALAFQLAARASRLAAPPRPLPLAMRALVYVAAVALILLPPAVLLLS